MSRDWNEVMEQERQKLQGGKVVPLFPSPHESALPGEQTDYKAASMPASGGLTQAGGDSRAQEFRNGGTPYHAFQYVHLGAEATLGFTPEGQVMSLHFTGMEPKILTIRGRNLLQIMDYIQLHRIHWIRQADRDFSPDEAVDDNGQPLPFIERIEITPAMTAGRSSY